MSDPANDGNQVKIVPVTAKAAKIVDELPPDIAQEIGQIVFRWAYAERLLTHSTYLFAGMAEHWARVVIRTDRPEGQLGMIEDMATLSNVSISPPLAPLKTQLTSLQKSRDALAHGVWIRKPDTQELCLLETSGKWITGMKSPKIHKRMFPAANPVTIEALRSIRAEIEVAIETLTTLQQQILGVVQSWQGKHPAQAGQGRPDPGQTGNIPQAPPSPSEE